MLKSESFNFYTTDLGEEDVDFSRELGLAFFLVQGPAKYKCNAPGDLEI